MTRKSFQTEQDRKEKPYKDMSISYLVFISFSKGNLKVKLFISFSNIIPATGTL